MGARKRILINGGFYHVYSRGVDKQAIFKDIYDFQIFINIIERSFENKKFKLHAYCLMNNHYHFLIETPKANLSEIMHEINFKYAKYFNAKYDRKGVLFESRFNSIIVNRSFYGLTLLRYIHMNPVEANLVTRPENWYWSSFKDYLRPNGNAESFLDTTLFIEYFPGKDIKKFIEYHDDIMKEDFHFILN